MERLTANDLNKVCYDPWELCGMEGYCTKGCHEEGGCTKGCPVLKMYRKLAEYETLEEQGKLLKLPCAVGDTVYVLRLDNTAYIMNNEKVWEIVEDKFEIFHFDSIGKTVFLTREEAEAALKELEKE